MNLQEAKPLAMSFVNEKISALSVKLNGASERQAERIQPRIESYRKIENLVKSLTSKVDIPLPSDIRANGVYRPGYDLVEWIETQCSTGGQPLDAKKIEIFLRDYCG